MSSQANWRPQPLPQPLHVGAWSRPEALVTLERGWRKLQESAGVENPFLSWEWQYAWVRSLPRGVKPVVVAQQFSDGSLAGVLALQVRWRRGWRQLEFLGQGSGGDDLDCLLHPAAPDGTAAQLLAAALRQQRWGQARLDSAAAQGALASCWREMFLPSRERVETSEWLPTSRLVRCLDDFLASRSANFRSEVRRRRRRFFREFPGAGIECVTAPQAVGAALQHLFRLHNLRRAQKQDVGLFESPRLRDFHLRAATALASLGIARVYLLRAGSTVVAALYGLEAGPRHARHFWYFQSGLDPAVSAFSPGTVLLTGVIENCMERGLNTFGFLRGEEAYKGRWADERHASMRLLAVHGRAGGAWLRLRHAVHRLRRKAA